MRVSLITAAGLGLMLGSGCSSGAASNSSGSTSSASSIGTVGTSGSTGSTGAVGATIGSTTGSSSTSTASSTASSGSSGSSSSGGSSGTTLAGTWDLITTPVGDSPSTSTLVVGQDSLSITSPGFTLTASRAGNVLTFDNNGGGGSGDQQTVAGTQAAAAFSAGIVPFILGGSWTIQGGPAVGAATVGCTLQTSGTEIDATCNSLGPTAPWFSFTTEKNTGAASSFGDFGGTWTNTWTWGAAGSPTYPCDLDFAGNDITTCDGGSVSNTSDATPLSGITFTYDGVNTISGSAQGWAEFSATRQ